MLIHRQLVNGALLLGLLLSTACGGIADTDKAGPPVASLTGTLSVDTGFSTGSETVKLALAWYPGLVGDLPLPEGLTNPPPIALDGQCNLASRTALVSQNVDYEAVFPIDFRFDLTTLPPEEALVFLDDIDIDSRVAMGILLVYADDNGNGTLDECATDSGPCPDRILGASGTLKGGARYLVYVDRPLEWHAQDVGGPGGLPGSGPVETPLLPCPAPGSDSAAPPGAVPVAGSGGEPMAPGPTSMGECIEPVRLEPGFNLVEFRAGDRVPRLHPLDSSIQIALQSSPRLTELACEEVCLGSSGSAPSPLPSPAPVQLPVPPLPEVPPEALSEVPPGATMNCPGGGDGHVNGAAGEGGGTVPEGEDISCPDIPSWGLRVTVVDGTTGDPICDASVTVEDGTYAEELAQLGPGAGDCRFFGAGDRAGTYAITAIADGYEMGELTGVTVERRTCGVTMRDVTVELTPASAPAEGGGAAGDGGGQ